MLFEELSLEEIVAIRSEEAAEDAFVIGHAEGHAERNKEIARNLLAKGSTPEFVSDITGLSLDEIVRSNR